MSASGLWSVALIVVALQASCAARDRAEAPARSDEPPASTAPSETCGAREPFAAASLAADVAALASPALGGRAPGSDGDRRARALIEARFRCLGLIPAGGAGYQQPFSDGRGHDTANVIGFVPGGDPEVAAEIVLVGAHHDHLGILDGILHPGANDDASGVAALLAIAQAIRAQPPAPRRTIAFVAFGAEEDPARVNGSTYYVDHPPADLPVAAVVTMINLDMVGSYDVEGEVNVLGSFRGTTGRAVVEARARRRPGLRVHLGDPGVGGDHESFCELGVPYLFFWTDGGTCYHEGCDTPDRIDGDHLAAIAELTSEVLRDLADSDADLEAEHGRFTCDGSRSTSP